MKYFTKRQHLIVTDFNQNSTNMIPCPYIDFRPFLV